MPPLRARPSDIPELVRHLLRKLARRNNQLEPVLSNASISGFQHYSYPGNVRGLENILERALALYEGSIIEPADLNIIETYEAVQSGTYNPTEISLEDYLEEIEKDAISSALQENRWNKTATAKYLGVSFRSLRYRLKKLGLE